MLKGVLIQPKKITTETPEVRFDKRKQRKKRGERGNRDKTREKREIKRENERK